MQASITFDELLLVLGVIVGAMSFIVLTYNVSKALREWRLNRQAPIEHLEEELGEIKPKIVPNLEARLEKIEKTLERHDEKLEGDWEFREETKDFERLMISSMKTLVEHLGDGEEKDIAELGKELDKYLIDHHK